MTHGNCSAFSPHLTSPRRNVASLFIRRLFGLALLTGAASISLHAQIVVPNNSYSSSYPNQFTNTTVIIEGLFTVNTSSFSIQSCTVKMLPGAEIVIIDHTQLNVGLSTISSDQGQMWKSISGKNLAGLKIYGCTISDAETAILYNDFAWAAVDGCEFVNNRVAISVPVIPGLSYNPANLTISNSTFHAEGPLLLPYSGQQTVLGQTGYAGLELNNTALYMVDYLGNGNVFHHLSNGIVMHNTDLELGKCTMEDITPDVAYASTGNGSGIYATSTGYNTLTQTGFGSGTGDVASFTNCRFGVFTDHMNVTSTQNRMVTMGTPYRAKFSANCDVVIENNRLDALFTGVDLIQNQGANHLSVAGNDITFGNLIPGQANTQNWGIGVAEVGTSNPDSKIIGNTVHCRTGAPNASIGIGLLGANDYHVVGNTVIMTSNAATVFGIGVQGCDQTVVSCNTVQSAGAYNGYLKQSAIYTMMSTNGTYSCNTVNHTRNGFYFAGNCNPTLFQGNNIHDHEWGPYLDGTAVIGDQIDRGNVWFGAPAVAGGFNAQCIGNPANSQFKVYPLAVGGGNTQPISIDPPFNAWFSLSPNPNPFQCAANGVNFCDGAQLVAGCTNCPQSLDAAIADSSIQNGAFTESTQWMLGSDLYKKLDDAPELRDADQQMADFYNEMAGSIIAQFKGIGDVLRKLYNMDPAVLAALEANKEQISDLMGQMKDVVGQLGDETLTPQEHANLQSTLVGYQNIIRDLTEYNNAALQMVTTTKALNADNVKAVNATLGTSEEIEVNKKQVNEIYLSTVAKGLSEFNTDQTTTLFAIANQCPMMGGMSVFKARSMYALINEDQQYDDPLLCLQHGIVVRSQQQAAAAGKITVVPNPATDNASLMLGGEWQTPGEFVLYNAVGAVVMRAVVPANTPQWEFSTTALAPAMYHYMVQGPTGSRFAGKLSIVR